MFDDILINFGLNVSEYHIRPFGSGLINYTYKISGANHSYILQQINVAVFKRPHHIDSNLVLIKEYLDKHKPGYLFVAPLKNQNGKSIIQAADGKFYRLFPFIEGSHTVNFLQDTKEAYSAAVQFGRFTRLLNHFDISKLEYTLPDFHNLKLRVAQFEQALKTAERRKLEQAAKEVKAADDHINILHTYNLFTTNNEIPLRVIHHDTKINNVLFDKEQNALCIVDLDTVMPGYYLSDVGDMMRTYLSPANEEEKDLDKIIIRTDFFRAIYKGYMSEMSNILTETEKQYFTFSGKLMIYMQGLRFLTDFLNNDIYYGTQYEGHNLIRAKNQFKLLEGYINAEPVFSEIIAGVDKELLTTANGI
ncbi:MULTISPECIES: phosphotransferase enzyme family protein [Mucilaginibacter]|jgi:Ser/Thr protein kinase RdoA (MazF antagonist)|uniref:phosphotransferase enzyme family protein n=1 Tax=Mucilaginibacter TaxID=423349 RepID=UPI00087151BE|nr:MULTISPECIES: aminoglycoside phosphotransferase family protein [Mucilaginibacter]NVM63017.1 Ser/Thr protein kinase RdoA (MazF antagonist) [Mucilaginibacter sp. SG538B]GGA89974.1 aminoglycoside phosphotransferase [Mucilaginibacter rubeus]SCW42849.1 Phosphotransferase enzyme family protein [Mucilaginibacter sp. NFR10]